MDEVTFLERAAKALRAEFGCEVIWAGNGMDVYIRDGKLGVVDLTVMTYQKKVKES